MKKTCKPLAGLSRLVLFVIPLALVLLTPELLRAEGEDERRVRVNVLRLEDCTDESGAKIPCHGVGHLRLGGFLGVQLTELTPELRQHFGAPESAGVMVSRVVGESPAEEAGVRVGDVIAAIDGEEVASARQLARRVRATEKGESLELEIWRDGSLERLTAWPEVREREVFDLSDMVIDIDRLETLPEHLEIHRETIERSLEKARRYLESEEMKRRLERIQEINLERLEERMERVRERLERLETDLERESERLERLERDDT